MEKFIHRVSPDEILDLKEGEVFVYGSNLSGRHGKGAARQALKWGAKWGVPFGLMGMTFGIPTKDKSVKRTLDIAEIKIWVHKFIEFAKSRRDLKFLVTEIGCGLAGLDPKDVAPLFKEATHLENVYLPRRFWKYLV